MPVSALGVRLLPAAYVPPMSLRQRARALTDRRVVGILAGTVTVLIPAFVVIAYLPAILDGSGAWIIVPEQHRLFAIVPALAPVAVGLNGSAIYIGSALGAGLGGLALAAGGPAAPVITASIVGAVAVTIAATVVPERITASAGSRRLD
jgi:MFS transporter, DHA1 family, inner membrane transport protein